MYPDIEEFKKLIQNNFSTRMMVKHFNKSQGSIKHWLKKFNLKTNIELFNTHEHCCKKCGNNDSNNFYGHRKDICKKCFNKKMLTRGQEKREYAVNFLGGKCIRCGYNEFISGLCFHHRDPKEKDKNFDSMRSWSLERILAEIKKCDLLCHNCHVSFHANCWSMPV